MELGHWPTRWSKIAPDKTVIKYGDLSLNWNEFNTRINQAAHAIQAAGMKKGDRLAVLLGNSNVFLEVFFAAAKLGVIFVPLNFRLSPPELAYQINETHPKILVYAPEFKELVNALKETCPEVSTWVCETAMGPADELVFESWIDSSPAAEPMPDSPVGMDDAVMIMYTSGTTGRPKGAVLSHGNIAWNSINAQHFNAYKGHEISLCNAPLFHIGAFNVIAMPFLYAGCRLVLQRFFEPAEALRLIESEKVTTMFGVPVMFQLMMNVPRWPDCDLSHVIYFISGGAPCPPVLIDAYLQKGVRFVQGYGMTESAAGVSMLAPQQASNKPGSAGVPLFHLQLAVVGRQGDHLGPGEIGEIWIKGPN
ncbi:MAG: AMP-binding protein, partial [Desulfatitalea sp.]|nr:AMP-binding protein [Desulfatitalea sp.]